MHKKRRARPEINRILIILAIAIAFAGFLLLEKPAITGNVIESEETVFKENLGLQLNESSTYQWDVKNPGNIKSLKVTGSTSSNGTARIYIEKNGTRQLLFDSGNQLFDVDVNVLSEYKSILQGGKIVIENSLFNLRGFGSGDVLVVYSIKDSKGNLIAVQEETIYVETRAKFLRELVIPSEIKQGIYTAFVEASSKGVSLGSGSDTFEVNAESETPYYLQPRFYGISAAIATALAVIIIWLRREFKLFRKKKGIAELKVKAPDEKILKLENELKALESARKAKLISNVALKKENSRIKAQLRKLKR
jgi:hypothetical protein